MKGRRQDTAAMRHRSRWAAVVADFRACTSVRWLGLFSVLSFAVPALAQTPLGHDSIRLLGVELRIDSQAAAHSDANSFQVPTGAAIELATSLVAGGSVVDPMALGLAMPLKAAA